MEERPSRTRGEQPKSYLERWSPLIEGVVVVDVKAANERIEAFLMPLRGATAGAIDSAYDSVGEVLDLSVKVAVKARRDYDLFKEEFEIWLESHRTSAREALEIEKAEKGWKKQITDGMVMDQVRATWPDEYSTRANQLKSFQATAHFFEARPDVVKQRARALDGQREIMLAKGGR